MNIDKECCLTNYNSQTDDTRIREIKLIVRFGHQTVPKFNAYLEFENRKNNPLPSEWIMWEEYAEITIVRRDSPPENQTRTYTSVIQPTEFFKFANLDKETFIILSNPENQKDTHVEDIAVIFTSTSGMKKVYKWAGGPRKIDKNSRLDAYLGTDFKNPCTEDNHLKSECHNDVYNFCSEGFNMFTSGLCKSVCKAKKQGVSSGISLTLDRESTDNPLMDCDKILDRVCNIPEIKSKNLPECSCWRRTEEWIEMKKTHPQLLNAFPECLDTECATKGYHHFNQRQTSCPNIQICQQLVNQLNISDRGQYTATQDCEQNISTGDDGSSVDGDGGASEGNGGASPGDDKSSGKINTPSTALIVIGAIVLLVVIFILILA
uniref:Uncharacterized protein n=1 Tax=viral metagenome TaxID=1070528 RepID=A0A6C0CKV8_9ZZZZ